MVTKIIENEESDGCCFSMQINSKKMFLNESLLRNKIDAIRPKKRFNSIAK